MEERVLELLKEVEAIQFGDFVLTSGKRSNYYVNIKKASTHPAVLKEIAKAMAKHVSGTRIAGMELGAVPIAVALSLETGIPYVMVRKGKREHGTGSQIEGELTPGEEVLVVEDVTTSGGSTLRTVEILREAGAVVKRAIVVVDRNSGAVELLAENGVELIPLVSSKDFDM